MAPNKINIDKLINSYLELASEDPSILNDMLKDDGYDPEQIEEKGTKFIRTLFFQQEVALKKTKLKDLYLKAASMVQRATEPSKETIFNMLKQKSPSLQFRSLDRLDVENLQQILDETEVLELIDQLEKKESK